MELIYFNIKFIIFYIKMNLDLLFNIIINFSTFLLVSVNISSIYHIIKIKDSTGVSKLSFWLLFLSFTLLTVYSTYYKLYLLTLSYSLQLLLIGIYLYFIYKYKKVNIDNIEEDNIKIKIIK